MPTAARVESIPYGLVTPDKTLIPLVAVSVEASITGCLADVTITQRYRNDESQPIEAVYVFPLDESATVRAFEATVGATRFVAEVMERDEAFKLYDEAMERGDGAYLLDRERADVFTVSVGQIPPGAEVELKLSYVTEVAQEGDAIRFVLPTTVSPRYAPDEDQRGVGQSEESRLNPPVLDKVTYGLSLNLSIDMPGAITRVESPSHPLSISIDGSKASARLAQRDVPLDRDVVVVIAADGLNEPHAWIERDEAGRCAAALVFRPEFDRKTSPSEIVFVVDRSGSMAGTSIAEVRNALQLSLRSLTTECRFNIVGFGSSFAALFPESRQYSEASLAEASAHVATLDANLGGTEILPALAFVLEKPLPMGGSRQVVVLSDGEVTNSDAVLALVRAHARTTRVFSFGIGHGASHHLVKGIARAGGGAAEFIQPGERIEAKVMRQFERLLSPAATDVRVDWGGAKVRQAPKDIHAVFAGGRVLVYGLLDTPTDLNVSLSLKTASGPKTFDVRAAADDIRRGHAAVTLAAGALIRDLEESDEGAVGRGSRQLHRKAGAVEHEIVRISKQYGVASRATSFVAVEQRTTPVEGGAQLRRVPIALTHEWGGLESRSRLRFSRTAYADRATYPICAVLPSSEFTEDQLAEAAPLQSRRAPTRERRPWRDRLISDHLAQVPTVSKPVARPLDTLVALQRADGAWNLTAEFAAAIGAKLKNLERALPPNDRDNDDRRRALATVVALAWLRQGAAEFVDEWTLLARKAEMWLTSHAVDEGSRRTWERLLGKAGEAVK